METAKNKEMETAKLRERLDQAQSRIRYLEGQLTRQPQFAPADRSGYQNIADQLPIAFWELDLGELKTFLSLLRQEGIADIESHLTENPQVLRQAVGLCTTKHINQATRDMFQARDNEKFAKNFEQLLTCESAYTLCRIIKQLDDGITKGMEEASFQSFDGEEMYLGLFWALAPDELATWNRALVALLDLTPRKTAEQSLSQSEDRYRSLFEANPSAMCLIEPSSGNIIDANPAACAFYGHSRQSLSQMTIDKLSTPDHPPPAAKLAQAAEGPIRTELRQRLAGGDIRNVEIYAGPFFDGADKIIHITIHDITRRTEVQESLREAEEKYRSVIEHSVQGIVETNLEGKILSMNPAMARIVGYRDVETARRELTDMSHVYDDIARRKQLLDELKIAGTVKSFPIKIKRRNGSHAWVSFTARAVKDENGRIKTIEGFAEDITSRVKAEEALAQSEKRYRAIVDNSLAAIYIFQNDKMVFVNRSFLDMIGYETEQDALGKPFWEFLHPLDRQWVKDRAQARARGENVKSHYAFRCIRKDGSVVWVDMQAATITFRGKPAILGNLIDITERKLLTDRLAQSQKMEAVGTLASGIAHDFNNILQAISGYVQMVISDGIDHSNMGRMKEIDSAVERAADLIQRMLAFSRDLEPQFIAVDINKEVKQAIKLIERTIPKWISINSDLDESLPLVNGDPIGLEQMLMNLAANARDAMPDGGTLIITTRQVDLDNSFCSIRPDLEPGSYVVLSVTDSGPGIDESIIKQIFDPFFSTKEIGRGTGLGLSQVYGTVKSHHGHIDCESTLGSGTEFKIYLPSRQIDQPAIGKDPKQAKPAGGNGETILLVDDESAILDVSGQILADHGYKVHTADCGEKALNELERLGGAHLVVLDLGMPGMGGRRCFEQIKKNHKQTKVIIASGYADEDNRKWAMAQGAEAFLPKPYRLPALLAEVKRVLGN